MPPHEDPARVETAASGQDQYFRTDHLLDAIGGHTARGGAVTIVWHGLKFVVSIGATAILAHLLTPNDYGLIGMVAVVTNFVAMFHDLGLSLATVQRSEITVEQISTLFWVNVGLSCLFCVSVIGAAPAVAWFYGEPRLIAITATIAVGFLFGGLSVQHEALLKRQMKFFTLSTIAFVSMTVGYAVGIIMAWRGAHYWALVCSQLALLFTNMIALWAACRWRPGPPRRHSGVRSMLSFGGNVTGYSAINFFARNTDTLLIGKFWGAEQLGFYNRAVQLASLPTDQINEPLGSVVIPALSRLAPTPERYRQGYLRIMEKVLLVTMPAVALMICTSDWLVYFVLGPQWTNAASIIVFIGIAGLFQPIANTAGWLLVTQGRTQDMLYWSIINAPVAILSVVVGLPWGAVGVAASYSVIRVLVVNPALYWFVGRSGPIRAADFYRLLTPFTLACGTAISACVVFRFVFRPLNPFLGIGACGAIVCLTVLGCLWWIPAGRSALLDVRNSIALLRPASHPIG